MSMTRDEDHQADDMNIGRIIEMYLITEISLSQARTDLAGLFGIAADDPRHTDFDRYIGRVLRDTKAGEVEAGDARANLVKLAALAQSGDNDFEAFITNGEA
jgi:hypothetical protein